MASYPNKLFKGWCSNQGNNQSNILHYEICTLRNIRDYNDSIIPEEIYSLEEYFNVDGMGVDEPYYAIYATFKMNINRGPIKIFETDELRSAIFIVEQLSGHKVVENEIHN